MSFWSKVKRIPWGTILKLGIPLLRSRIQNKRARQAIDLLEPILTEAHGPDLKAQALAIIDAIDRRSVGLDEQARQARERARDG